MSAEEKVAEALRASVILGSICGGKIFPVVIPQGERLPAMIYQRVGTSPDMGLSGYGSESATIMINCFSLIYAEAKGMARAARRALAAIGASFEDEQDLYDDKNGVYCVSSEYIVHTILDDGGICYG